MNKAISSNIISISALALSMGAGFFAATPTAQAATTTYNVVTTWYEPDTQPKNSVFTGSFTWDEFTKTVTNLNGTLSESMTGGFPPPSNSVPPLYDQTLLTLTYMVNAPAGKHATQWHDTTLGGTFATVFLKDSTDTYSTFLGGDGWHPTAGVQNMGLYNGFPGPYANSIQNAYAMIFVPDALSQNNPNITLTWNEAAQTGSLGLAYTSYADCAPGGMMGAVCMTSWSEKAYGSVGTMSGYPYSQVITAASVPAPVPLPSTLPLLAAGLGMIGSTALRRRRR
jgi:hypothetical protein